MKLESISFFLALFHKELCLMSVAASCDGMICDECGASLEGCKKIQTHLRGVDGQEGFFRIAFCQGEDKRGCGRIQCVGESKSTPWEGVAVIRKRELSYGLIQQLSERLLSWNAEAMGECGVCAVAPAPDSVSAPA